MEDAAVRARRLVIRLGMMFFAVLVLTAVLFIELAPLLHLDAAVLLPISVVLGITLLGLLLAAQIVAYRHRVFYP